MYSFNEGSMFYSDKVAYEVSWGEALKNFKYCIQTKKSIPSRNTAIIEFLDGKIVNKSTVIYGDLTFNIYKPFVGKVGIDLIDTYKCRQNKFLEFLKNGVLETTSGKTIDFFAE